MKIKDFLPSQLKWLQYLPVILTDKFFTYIKGERRWWVIILMFVMVVSITFRDTIKKRVTNYDPVHHEILKDMAVHQKLNHILDHSGADRAYVFQFHNGLTYYTGEHAQRFSCTYEVVSDGTSREKNNLQNLQVSLFAWWANEVINGRMLYTDLDSISDYTTRVTLESQGIQSLYCLPMISKGKIIGITGIDYVRNSNGFLNKPVMRDWYQKELTELTKLIINE